MAEWMPGSAALWTLAVLAVVWMLGPVVMFHARALSLRLDVVTDLRRAAADDDPEYAHLVNEFSRLGFRPVGATVESGWFINPLTWYRRFPLGRWLSTADGEVFVHMFRLFAGEPRRLAVVTLNDGGGFVRTVWPSVGVKADYGGNSRRIEVENGSPDALVSAHRREVDRFFQEKGLSIKRSTLSEVVQVHAEMDRRLLPRAGGGSLSLVPILILALQVVPDWSLPQRDAAHPALSILEAAGFFTILRLVMWHGARSRARSRRLG